MNALARSPAGFWKRYVAYFIDVMLLYAVIEVLSTLFFSGSGAAEIADAKALVSALLNQRALPEDPIALSRRLTDLAWRSTLFSTFAYVLVGGAYFVACESSARQATLGKRLLGIKVTDREGRRIGPGRALGRFFAAGLSWLTFNLGHALAAWTPERRALHDYVAGTRVDNVDPTRPQMPLWGWAIVGLHALAFLLFVFGTIAVMVLALNALNNL